MMSKSDNGNGAAAQREAPVIPTHQAWFESEGVRFCHLVCDLPDGTVLQDLQDSPKIWRLIQSKGLPSGSGMRGLRRGDEVTCYGPNREWAAQRCMVTNATASEVQLNFSSKQVVRFEPEQGHWEDENTKIHYSGTGFRIFSKAANTYLPGSYSTLAQAKNEYFSRLPKSDIA